MLDVEIPFLFAVSSNSFNSDKVKSYADFKSEIVKSLIFIFSTVIVVMPNGLRLGSVRDPFHEFYFKNKNDFDTLNDFAK